MGPRRKQRLATKAEPSKNHGGRQSNFKARRNSPETWFIRGILLLLKNYEENKDCAGCACALLAVAIFSHFCIHTSLISMIYNWILNQSGNCAIQGTLLLHFPAALSFIFPATGRIPPDAAQYAADVVWIFSWLFPVFLLFSGNPFEVLTATPRVQFQSQFG